ncbi:MAG: VOC family protein [Candidatus Aminicenantia bacterium]
MKIDHIAIAVKNIDEAIEKWGLFLEATPEIITIESERVRAFFINEKEAKIEIISPLGENSPISNFLSKRGEGLHHICIAVENFDELRKRLTERNIQIAKEGTGYDGKRILFCHPSSFNSVLIEFKEL